MRMQHCLQKTAAVLLGCGRVDSWVEWGVLCHGAISERNIRMETVQAQLSMLPMATWGWERGEAPLYTHITAGIQNASLNASNESLGPSLDLP